MAKKVESRYYEMLWKMLTQGATKQLESRKEGEGSELITNFSPNNLRRLVLGLDGIFVQFYVNEGTGVSRKMRLQTVKMDDELLAQLCNPELQGQVYMPLDMLHRSRVFSSIEEIIVLGNDGKVPYSFANSGIDWFTREPELVARSFKRLRCVTYLDTSESVEEFIQGISEILDDPLVLVTSVLEDEGKYINIINDEKYVTRTALRPQYYQADALDGTLANYFERVKKLYEEDYKRRLLQGEVEEVGVEYDLDTVEVILNKFIDKVLPIYDKEDTLSTGVEELAKLVVESGIDVNENATIPYKYKDLSQEHKQYGVLLNLAYDGVEDKEKLASTSVKLVLEQLDACSILVRKYKLPGVLPKIKSLGLYALVQDGFEESKVSDYIGAILEESNKYLDIFERLTVIEAKGLNIDKELNKLDRATLEGLGYGVANFFGYDFEGISEELLVKLSKIEVIETKWSVDVDKLKNLVGSDLLSKDILGNDYILMQVDKLGVDGFLEYAVKYNVYVLEDLINLVVVLLVNKGTDLELSEDTSLADLASKVAKKRNEYKELVLSYTTVRDKLSHERFLTYLEGQVPKLDNFGLLLLQERFVTKHFFDWLVESDANVPLIFAFKSTGDIVYTEDERLYNDKLLHEVFKKGNEPLAKSIEKLRYAAKYKPPKNKGSERARLVGERFREALRKVDGIDE